MRSALQVETEFRLFWRLFPSRKPHASPKKAAQQLFEALVNGGTDPTPLIAAAERYARAVSGTNPQYICQAVTWLRQRRWEEDAEKGSDPVSTEPRVLRRIPVSDDEWRRRIEAFQRAGGTSSKWPRMYGLPPMHNATDVPRHIRQEFGFS